MRIVKGPCLIDIGPNPTFLVRAEGEHEFNKTTETQSLQRKTTSFCEKKR
jgi:hypothetical protein